MIYMETAFVFIVGIIIGSFLNVCIFRIPEKQSIVVSRSHCMNCGYQLQWYDMFPILSYLFLRGKCRRCKHKISVQYPIIEALNGILYVAVFMVYGFGCESIIYCFLTSALIVLSVIDFRTYEIPVSINIFIFVLGIIHLFLDRDQWINDVIGFFAVSVFLLLLHYFSKGRAIGGGDVKLMAVCGLLLGWKNIILAFFLGCVIGSVIHLIRMKVSGQNHVLAMGPYLSVGIFIALLFGNEMIDWYMSFLLN